MSTLAPQSGLELFRLNPETAGVRRNKESGKGEIARKDVSPGTDAAECDHVDDLLRPFNRWFDIAPARAGVSRGAVLGESIN